MAKKILPIFITAILAVGSGAFYGGMKYDQSSYSAGFGQGGLQSHFSQTNFQELQNLSPEERQQRLQEMGTANISGGARGFAGRTGSSFASGEIISKDEQSIIIKLPDGGSRIVFYSDSAEISKFLSGSIDDLEVGKSVVVNGQANDDGSITAQSVQLRPEINLPQ